MPAQIRCGTAATQIGDQWVGRTVGELRRLLLRDLGIPEGAPAMVSRDAGANPSPVREDYRLSHGDLLEFVRPAGTKGRRKIRVQVG